MWEFTGEVIMLNAPVHQKNCKKNNLITDLSTGEVACSNCGAVSEEKSVYSGPENSILATENYLTSSRVGQKISLRMADMGLSTLIESKNKDATGKTLSNENRRMFYRLRIWDRNSRYANTSQSYQKAFILLDAIRTKLGLPESVIEHTAYLFRKVSTKKLLSGRSTIGIICATTYIACRLTNTPRTLQDVALAGNIKRKTLQRIYRFLVRELDIYPETYNPHEFVSRISKAIHISEKTERLAFKIVSLCEKNGISASKNPLSIAAAVVHLAVMKNDEKVSQRKISEASGVSTVTIRERANEIKNGLGGEI
jgi:transcription initiation factor TFIIB